MFLAGSADVLTISGDLSSYLGKTIYKEAAVGGSIGYAIYSFVKMPSDKQLNKVREWLLYAVTKAEKELGAGTGKLKLRYVYDMFVARFEWLAKVITFDMFSMMVDEALEQMRTMLDSNEAVQKLIANEAGEGSE